MKKSIFLFYCLLVHLCSATTLFAQQNDVLIPGVKKIKDVIIYNNSSLKFEIKAKQFYAASQRVL